MQTRSSAIGTRNGLGQMRLAREKSNAIKTRMKNGVNIRKMGGGGLIAIGVRVGRGNLLLNLHDRAGNAAGQDGREHEQKEEAEGFHRSDRTHSKSRGKIGDGGACSPLFHAIPCQQRLWPFQKCSIPQPLHCGAFAKR